MEANDTFYAQPAEDMLGDSKVINESLPGNNDHDCHGVGTMLLNID